MVTHQDGDAQMIPVLFFFLLPLPIQFMSVHVLEDVCPQRRLHGYASTLPLHLAPGRVDDRAYSVGVLHVLVLRCFGRSGRVEEGLVLRKWRM
jgi:hypothetical protein